MANQTLITSNQSAKKSLSAERHREKGVAAVAVILVAFFTMLVCLVTVGNNLRQLRGQDSEQTRYRESLVADSAANTLEQIIKTRALANYRLTLDKAHSCQPSANYPVYDDAALPADQTVPVVTFNEAGEPVCNQGGASVYSSFIGNLASYAALQVRLFTREAEGLGLDNSKVAIVNFSEVVRLSGNGVVTAYVLQYTLDARGGRFGRVRRVGKVVLGTQIASCNVSATMITDTPEVLRGDPASLKITYTGASILYIYDANGAVYSRPEVVQSSEAQEYVFNFIPTDTLDYYVEARSATGECISRSALVRITVKPGKSSTCPEVLDFSQSKLSVNTGESVTISWNVNNAATLTLQVGTDAAQPISAIDSQSFLISKETVFILKANDKKGRCPIERQLVVSINAAAACTTSPTIDRFDSDPAAVLSPGSDMALVWSVSNVKTGGKVWITSAFYNQNDLDADSGTDLQAPFQQGDYQMTLYADNVCADGRRVSVKKTIVIQIRNCVPPQIKSFAVSPETVYQGSSQKIRFTWEVIDDDNNLENLHIETNVGSYLPLTGFLDYPPPIAGTSYHLVADHRCGQAVERQANVGFSSCVPISIDSFTASPETVVAGGSEKVRLAWTLTGTADTLSISGIGNVSGNYVDIPQPQTTTTYTITATGCGGRTVSKQVPVSVTASPNYCAAGKRLRTATRSIGTTTLTNPYVNPYIEITAGARYDEATRHINFNFSISNYAAAQNANPTGSSFLEYASPNSSEPLIEIGELRFFTQSSPARVLVYQNTGAYPGQLISTIPLVYKSYYSGQAGSGAYYTDYYSVNSGSPFTDDGADIPFFNANFNPTSDSMKIYSHLFPGYAPSKNGGGTAFNTYNTAVSSTFGCTD